MVLSLNIARRSLPLLALAVATSPAKADTVDLSLACDTAFAPALRRRICNASPIFPFTFPEWITLGGEVQTSLARHGDPGVASAIRWRFVAMWTLVVSYLLFMGAGIVTGHFRRDFLPVGPVSILRDFVAAATFRLEHRLGEYNAVQKAAYLGVLTLVAIMILSGIAIWKPVQTYPLELLFGGFQGARLVHFIVMAGIVLFILVHVGLTLIVLLAMVADRATEPRHIVISEKAL